MSVGRRVNFAFIACAGLAAFALLSASSPARSREAVLYSFTGGNDGGNAASGLVFDGNGNAYGTTVTGGTFDCGTVFELTPMQSQWHESVLYNFSCGSDGKNPHGGVTFDGAGNLYGTTVAGGSGGACTGDGCGVVFELTPSGEQVLYNFTGGNDGFGPGNAVVFDKAGNLYGMTPDGGTHSNGTVYRLSKVSSQWHETILHNFTGGVDGGVGSLGPLLLDSAGHLFGTTEVGGAYSAGTVFKMSQTPGGRWRLRTLYAFKGQPDAGFPYGGVVADGAGNLYGTTYFGGRLGAGAVFKLSPAAHDSWNAQVLYDFTGGTDGGSPTSPLLFDAAGHLFGTTSAGGLPGCNCGTVFKLTRGSWRETVPHRFGRSLDGAYPYYGLTRDATGKLFSTTVAGGLNNQGTVFALQP